jgi:hypothetical protein
MTGDHPYADLLAESKFSSPSEENPAILLRQGGEYPIVLLSRFYDTY